MGSVQVKYVSSLSWIYACPANKSIQHFSVTGSFCSYFHYPSSHWFVCKKYVWKNLNIKHKEHQ